MLGDCKRCTEESREVVEVATSALVTGYGGFMKTTKVRVKWEVFCDESFYGMWAVRPVGDHDFLSPRLFHLPDKEAAEKFKRLLDKSYHTVLLT